MVANVMHSRTSHIQTSQDIFNLLKGSDPSYHVLQLGNILPINNWYMAQNVIFAKVKTLKGQCHRSKQMAPSDSLTSKT